MSIRSCEHILGIESWNSFILFFSSSSSDAVTPHLPYTDTKQVKRWTITWLKLLTGPPSAQQHQLYKNQPLPSKDKHRASSMETIRPPLVIVQHIKEIMFISKASVTPTLHVILAVGRQAWSYGIFLILQSPLEKSTQILGKTEIKNTTRQFCLKSLATADDFYICPHYLFHFYCTSTWSLKSSI